MEPELFCGRVIQSDTAEREEVKMARQKRIFGDQETIEKEE